MNRRNLLFLRDGPASCGILLYRGEHALDLSLERSQSRNVNLAVFRTSRGGLDLGSQSFQSALQFESFTSEGGLRFDNGNSMLNAGSTARSPNYREHRRGDDACAN